MSQLNIPVIKQLILKDWFLNRKYVALYSAGSLFALSFISLGEWQFFMGVTLLMSMLIGMANHQISITIVNERKEQTLPFIMSLPITPIDYALAKLIANTTLYLIPWFVILLATLAVFTFTHLPDGLIPFSIIMCTYFLLSYFIVWSVGMNIESEGIVIFIMILLNCLIGPIIYTVGKTSSISQYFQSPHPVWNSTSVGVLLAEIAMIVLAIVIAIAFQARKKTFL